ncbi:hypothetical protein R16034_02645 [Ralstonia edaphis]|uniref:Uncharacterized protein n=1 Tax=Ralstonia edaphi TaxID=3058599 RepID=A0AB72X3L5_9RALS|nr:hypothetical protein R16034_02645 [Ralstonia sp. LMG 6871]
MLWQHATGKATRHETMAGQTNPRHHPHPQKPLSVDAAAPPLGASQAYCYSLNARPTLALTLTRAAPGAQRVRRAVTTLTAPRQ